MTGLTREFTPGRELQCAACEYRIGDLIEPSCLIAIELADDGERMSNSCCPPEMSEQCPTCGSPGGPCPTCLMDERGDA